MSRFSFNPVLGDEKSKYLHTRDSSKTRSQLVGAQRNSNMRLRGSRSLAGSSFKAPANHHYRGNFDQTGDDEVVITGSQTKLMITSGS